MLFWPARDIDRNTHQIPEPAQWNLENAFLSSSIHVEHPALHGRGIHFVERAHRRHEMHASRPNKCASCCVVPTASTAASRDDGHATTLRRARGKRTHDVRERLVAAQTRRASRPLARATQNDIAVGFRRCACASRYPVRITALCALHRSLAESLQSEMSGIAGTCASRAPAVQNRRSPSRQLQRACDRPRVATCSRRVASIVGSHAKRLSVTGVHRRQRTTEIDAAVMRHRGATIRARRTARCFRVRRSVCTKKSLLRSCGTGSSRS